MREAVWPDVKRYVGACWLVGRDVSGADGSGAEK